MPRTPQHFRYGRALLIVIALYSLLISLVGAAILVYIAIVRVPADMPFARAICTGIGLYIPVLVLQRVTLYFSRITLDPRGITVAGPLRRAFVAWSDIYVLERVRRHTPGGPDLNALYAVVVNTEYGPRELVVCDEMLPNYERLIDQIRSYAPRVQYREL